MTAPAPEPRLVILTPQQRKVIGHLTHDGAPDAVIAHRLGLSVWTIRSHIKAVMRQTGAHSRAQLVVQLLKRHVVVRVESRPSRHQE